MQSWNKYRKNSVHISGKLQARNGKLWYNTREVKLFSINMYNMLYYYIIMYYVNMFYVSMQTITVDFTFKYIKKKKPQ